MSDILTVEAHGASYRVHNPGGIIGNCLQQGTAYERKALEHIQRLRLRGTAVDAGAGIGNHTLWLAAVCGLHVEAFEPLDYHRLVANLALNPDLRVNAHGVGLGDTTQPGCVTPAPAHVTGRALMAEDTVAIHQLDEYRLQNVSLIKIDVEGMEPEVLRGARATIRRWRPVLYVEAQDEAAHKRNAAEIPQGYVKTAVFGATPLEEWQWRG